jgi:hypothetical protein
MAKLDRLFLTLFMLSTAACSTQYSAMSGELYVPQASLNDGNRQHFLDDAQMCREQVFKDYKNKRDFRNINTDFRTCLIDKGYMLLS